MEDRVKEFYLLQGGTYADPDDVETKDGVLRHKSGLCVAMDGNGKPQTVGGDAVANGNVAAANAGKPEEPKTEEPKAEDKPAEDVGLVKPSPVDDAK